MGYDQFVLVGLAVAGAGEPVERGGGALRALGAFGGGEGGYEAGIAGRKAGWVGIGREVVPGQVAGGDRDAGEAGGDQLRGLGGPRQRPVADAAERHVPQPLPRQPRLLPPGRAECAVTRRLPMPHQKQESRHRGPSQVGLCATAYART